MEMLSRLYVPNVCTMLDPGKKYRKRSIIFPSSQSQQSDVSFVCYCFNVVAITYTSLRISFDVGISTCYHLRRSYQIVGHSSTSWNDWTKFPSFLDASRQITTKAYQVFDGFLLLTQLGKCIRKCLIKNIFSP